MDPVSAVFYALVCGTLAATAPAMERRWARFLLGIVTGVVASNVLPLLRGALGL
jgi:hypothetical protein